MLELVDPRDHVKAAAARTEKIKEGASTLLIPLAIAFSGEDKVDQDELLWYRLRYRITPDDKNEGRASSSAVRDPISARSDRLLIESSSSITNARRLHSRWPPRTRGEARQSLRLSVSYDRTETTTGSTVTCKVVAERASYGGMMLAEVGLPPGAEVDRASLERLVAESAHRLPLAAREPDQL